mmetsp:Transcript_30970/g.99918  ORF Transcript_30970/g.99918 Transcript_30970/m.99918 type:complete len:217 (-) Transcript_30970:2004-2654(-)
MPRRPPLPVLLQERRRPRDGPPPGHRLGHEHSVDVHGRPPPESLRLRRRLRHRLKPLPHAGRPRRPSDGLRHGRPNKGLHPHRRYVQVRRARDFQSAPSRHSSRNLQPGRRDPPRPRHRRHDLPPDRRRRPLPPESTPRGRRERTRRLQSQIPIPRLRAYPPRRRPLRRSPTRRPKVQGPLHQRQNPPGLLLEQETRSRMPRNQRRFARRRTGLGN